MFSPQPLANLSTKEKMFNSFAFVPIQLWNTHTLMGHHLSAFWGESIGAARVDLAVRREFSLEHWV